jgi:arylsulfatase
MNTKFKNVLIRISISLVALTIFFVWPAHAQDTAKPNIVLVFMDNFGYGELGVYGGGLTRGAPTPRIDSLAADGLRLTNFNVEAQCTPSRAAIMTGRYAIRTGNASVPLSNPLYGLTQWEYTMPEMLGDAGYVTGMFGKWHLGHTDGRYPTDQGFDEWYGIPNSSDESIWVTDEDFQEGSHPYAVPEHVFHGRDGKLEKVKIYGPEERLEMDGEITEMAIDFMKRSVEKGKPFFAFLPYTQTHGPVKPGAEFRGHTGNGSWADVLAQTDAYVGRLLDSIDELGVADNTIFIFTADNGPEMTPGHHGWSGPWRGSYFTGLEGSLRVPFLIRWPSKIEKGRVSNEIVHEMDLFSTFANVAGGKLPKDRVLDSIDQSTFFAGKQEKSDREGIVVYVGNDIYGVKWRNWKMMFSELNRGTDAKIDYPLPRFYNLYTDPKEEYPLLPETLGNLWVRWPAGQVLTDHLTSLKEEPPVPAGTPDPYTPTSNN